MAELSDRDAVKGIMPALTSQGIKPEILLTCAGIQRRHPSEKFPDEDWDEVRRLNCSPCLADDPGVERKSNFRLHIMP